MRIVCPECHAAYQVGAIIKNAILVCHRCNTEFDTYGNRIVDGDETSQIFEKQAQHAPTTGVKDLIQSGMRKKHTRVWLWMLLILAAIGIAGVVTQWPYWKHSSLVRGISITVNPETPIMDSDWSILAETVQAHWLKREDNSLVLLVEGEVKNRTGASLPPPEIRITFVTQIGENIIKTLPITEPADMKTLKAVPFMSPPVDTTPVPMLGSRGFLLLIEDAPQATRHILLHAVAMQTRHHP